MCTPIASHSYKIYLRKPVKDDMAALNGKWKLTEVQGFSEYMDAIGNSRILQKICFAILLASLKCKGFPKSNNENYKIFHISSLFHIRTLRCDMHGVVY